MTKIAIVPNAAGTGTFTIEAPNSNSNRTLVLPDSAGTVATAESTLAQFNVTGSAPVYACRAWVNFNGVTTATIRGSGNVSSVTRNGAGIYTINFAAAMPDLNYATIGQAWWEGVTGAFFSPELPPVSTTSKIINTINTSATATVDINHITVAFFR
jgi:hypothetical protein